MNSQNFSPSSLDCDILDQFIGPNGEEPQILLSVGSKTLVTTDGYPPWVSFSSRSVNLKIFIQALRLTSMYPFPSPYSDHKLNEILYRYSSVMHRHGT